MWSNVLNSPLTEISATGTKLKTKVFAGGAVVAEQMVLASNLVQWISADPVTGSSVRIAKNGAFDNYQRTELEPLGQEVFPFEPPDEVPEPSNANGVFSAEEPEWQCRTATATGKSFFAQPVHCQRAQMERGGVSLPELFPSETEGNVRKIELTDSPLPDIDSSASDETLAYAVASTSKSRDRKPRKKENKAGPTPKWEVNIQIRPDPIEFNNAEYQGQDTEIGTRRKGKKGLGPEGDLDEFLTKNPNCLVYLRKILGDKEFGSFMSSLSSMTVIDVTSNPQLLNKTLTELQIPGISDEGAFSPATGTLGEWLSVADAIASPDTNSAYLGRKHLDNSQNDTNHHDAKRGSTLFHEQLHIFFRANHVGILRALGLPAQQSRTIEGVEVGGIFNFRTGKFEAGTKTKSFTLSADQESSAFLNKWLTNNCQ